MYKPRFAAIEIRIQNEGLAAIPSVCVQCEEPACVKSCPKPGAIFRDEEKGIVRVVDEKCTGCGVCVDACPIGAIKIEPASLKAIKCDLCDENPACVKFCPTGALALTKI